MKTSSIKDLGHLPTWRFVHRSFCGILLFAGLTCVVVSLTAATTIQYSYDTAGRLTQVDYGGGKRIEYVYDPAGNLLRRSIVSFRDSDGDQIDDQWEERYFGGIAHDGLTDSDGDGQSDLHEFVSGTDPIDPDSVLKMIPISEQSPTQMRIEWQTQPGRLYRVQYKTDLKNSPWIELTGEVTAQKGTASVVDVSVSEETQRYYRVVLAP